MNSTEIPEATRPSILDDVEVKIPAHAATKTRKYICGIRKRGDTAHLEFQIRVGPVCFPTETFEWEGKGESAKQVFKKGAIYDLTDAQVEEVKAKIQHRYIRRIRGKDKNGPITGCVDIDASDGGSMTIDPKNQERIRHPAARNDARLNGDEEPLKNLIFMEPCYDNPKLGGRVVTVADLKAMLAEAEIEEQRMLSGDNAVFEAESGKGGKLEKLAGRAAERDAKMLNAMNTTDGKKKADGGYLGK